MTERTTVAVLGTGIMGAPMARNITAAGIPVRAWNRTAARAEALAGDGVTVAASPAEAAAGAGVVVTMLADGPAVAETMAAALPAMEPGAVWVQSSTVGIAHLDRLAQMAAERPVAFVDAPVLGTKQPAEAGQLVVLGSGPEEARAHCEPVFSAIATRTLWLGPAGAGTRLKLVANSWIIGLLGALAESVALAEGLGLPPRLFLDTIAGGAIDTPYAHIKGPAMIDGMPAEASFPLRLTLKDARLVVEAARSSGLDPVVQPALAELLQQAVERGHGDEDMAAAIFGARNPG